MKIVPIIKKSFSPKWSGNAEISFEKVSWQRCYQITHPFPNPPRKIFLLLGISKKTAAASSRFHDSWNLYSTKKFSRTNIAMKRRKVLVVEVLRQFYNLGFFTAASSSIHNKCTRSVVLTKLHQRFESFIWVGKSTALSAKVTPLQHRIRAAFNAVETTWLCLCFY